MPLHLGAPELPCQARLHLLALRSEVSQLRSPLAAFGPRGKPGTPLWVVFQKMPQRHKQLRSMSHSPLVQDLVNVVDDHGSYDFAAVMLFREATCQGRGADFRDVLMLCDGGDLVLLKATEADAVLQ
jgi:hypothetical protein